MLGDTHGDICSLLPLFLEPEARRCTRFKSTAHLACSKRRLMAPTLRSFGVPFSGSRVYNKLPQHNVDSESCNEFQHHLNVYAKDRCRAGAPEQRMIYSPRRELYGHS